METEHSETIVDKAVAFVKDFLTSDSEERVLHRPVPEHDLSTDEALRLEDPHGYIFNKIVERSQRSCEEE